MRFLTSATALLGILCLASCSTVERVADYYKYRGEYHVRTVATAKKTTRPTEAKPALAVESNAAVIPAEKAALPAATVQQDRVLAKATPADTRSVARKARPARSEKAAISAQRTAPSRNVTQLSSKEVKASKGTHSPVSAMDLAMAMAGSNQILATVLCFFFGVLGVHRFYLGYIWQGVVQLLTFGGFFIWALIDLIRIIIGDLQPIDGSYDVTF